jgi:peptide/nickel transport system substrate-binding protein
MPNRCTKTLTAVLLTLTLVACAGQPAVAPTTSAPAQVQPTTSAPTQVQPTAQIATPTPKPGGDLVMGLNAEPQTLDPATAVMEQEGVVMRNIYDTVIYVDHNNNLHPGLATSWQQSADASTFTFKIRTDVTFQDGTPFDAQALKSNFDRFGDPKVGTGAVSTYFADYKGTEILDPSTVRVSFGSPHSTFLLALGYGIMGIASPTAVQKWGKDYGQHPVGTGPFAFDSWQAGQQITLVRNPSYKWAPDFFNHQGPAYLDRVVFRFIPEDATRLSMLQTGEASVIEQFPAQDYSWLQKDSSYYLVSGEAPGLPTIMMMNTQKPPTDELAVRQALIYATDQEGLVAKAYYETQIPAHGVLAPTTLDYDPQAGQQYKYDPEKAKAILQQAGWVDTNGDGIRERNGKQLEIYYPAYRVWEGSYMEMLQSMWTSVGFKVDMDQLEDAAAWDAAATGKHNVTNMGSISFDASVLIPAFDSSNINTTGGYDFTLYRDPNLDKLLVDAGKASDPAQRADLYAQAQRLIMDQALIIPIYDFERILAVRASFVWVTMDYQNWYPYFYDVYMKQ